MTQHIKYHFFKRFFSAFSILADWSGGWRIFVFPKLLFGSLMVGVGFNSCKKEEKVNAEVKTKQIDSVKVVYSEDSIEVDIPTISKIGVSHKVTKPVYCYVPAYENIEIKAIFPGGENELQRYLYNNMTYPASAIENGIGGEVIVEFYVETDGSISDIHIARSIDEALDKESIRLIKRMPKWIPATQNGKAIRQCVQIPVVFDPSGIMEPRVLCYSMTTPVTGIKSEYLNKIKYYVPTVNNEILSKIGRIDTYGVFECELTFNKAGFLTDYFIIQSLDDKEDNRIITAIKALSQRNRFNGVTVRLTLNPPSDFVWEFISDEN